MASDSSQGQAGPSGFGGWLVLLAIGQTAMPFATVIKGLTILFASDETINLPDGEIALYGRLAFYAALLFIEIVCLHAMYRRSKEYPRLFLLQWIAVILVSIGDAVILFGVLSRPVLAVVDPNSMSRMLSPIFTTGLGVWYLFESTRARNTFIQ